VTPPASVVEGHITGVGRWSGVLDELPLALPLPDPTLLPVPVAPQVPLLTLPLVPLVPLPLVPEVLPLVPLPLVPEVLPLVPPLLVPEAPLVPLLPDTDSVPPHWNIVSEPRAHERTSANRRKGRMGSALSRLCANAKAIEFPGFLSAQP
jgi:hypothetical protein